MKLTIAERRVLEAKAAYDRAPKGMKLIRLVRLRDATTAALGSRRKAADARAKGRGA